MTEKKYLRDNKKLMVEWDYEKNTNIDPLKLGAYSHKKVYWKCSVCGFEWKAAIYSRTAGNGCRACAGKVVISGKNDLATTHKEIVKEWLYPVDDYDNRIYDKTITPETVSDGSNKRVMWKCSKCGNTWSAYIYSRALNNTGCRECALKNVKIKPIPIEESLAAKHKEIADEWLYPVNKEGNQIYDERITPETVSSGSNRRVMWKCSKCGYEWKAEICNRTSGNGCPECKKGLKTSFPEQAIYFYLKKIYNDTENRKNIDDMEVDVFIPSLNLGIEYDGILYHKSEKAVNREKLKNDKLRELGIRLIRVKEKNDGRKPTLKNDIITFTIDSGYKQIDDVISLLIKKIQEIDDKSDNIFCDVNIKRDRAIITKQYKVKFVENNVAEKYPFLVKYWNPELNNGLTLEQFTCGSHYNGIWTCEKGHLYQSTIKDMTRVKDNVRGNGCPICAGKEVLKGFNDLATQYPSIAEQWHPYKNGDLTPENVYAKSRKKVWWMCRKCGYEWEAKISGRVRKSGGCPKCHDGKQSN